MEEKLPEVADVNATSVNNMGTSTEISQNTNSETDNDLKEKKNSPRLSPFLFLAFIVIAIVFIFYKYPEKISSLLNLDGIIIPGGQTGLSDISSLKKFTSEQEFKLYMENSSQQVTGMFGVGSRSTMVGTTPMAVDSSLGQANKEISAPPASGLGERYSETNVQVKGIDEPDIVKTDGNNIFVSNLSPVIFYGTNIRGSSGSEISNIAIPSTDSLDSKMIAPQRENTLKTKIIGAFPIESMVKKSEIEKSGEMFLSDNVLTIFSGNSLYAYDVSDQLSPKEIWKYDFDERNYLLSSRLKDGKIYLAFRLTSYTNSCDIPVTMGSNGIKISCMEIYRPEYSIPADSIFTVLKLDLKTGKVDNKNSFVGSSGLSVLYMSPENIYLTYTYYEDLVTLFYNFYETEGKGLLSTEVMTKLKNLKGLDLSTQSKLTELSVILDKYKQTLSSDDLLKIETETQNKLSEYLKKNVRSFEHSGIIKIDVQNLNIVSVGSIPGKPLNQFSLDEFEGNLRVATTVGDGMFSDFSVNDVYVLDKNLKESGKVTDMGVGERIYSVRFIEDRGYVVTFKQTDPFYVLDLGNPKDPKKTGELKIPGYSSYLHKLEKDMILGVGMEGSKVKLSLFDVSDSSNPKEISKYSLDEYWSEVSNTHHAFLQDEKNNIFFMPGGKGGYILSYKDSKLNLVKAVSDVGIKRALYINNYLYLVGSLKITVLDESSWESVKTFSL
jgi:inhibitor of cysteine peptidase